MKVLKVLFIAFVTTLVACQSSTTTNAGSSTTTGAVITTTTTVAPITPAPITPAPITPAPITPAPITPVPPTPAPITPVPPTPAPPTPVPATPAPAGCIIDNTTMLATPVDIVQTTPSLTTFQIINMVRLGITVSYTVCNVDLSAYYVYSWAIYDSANILITSTLADVRLSGMVAILPAGFFTISGTYTAKLTARLTAGSTRDTISQVSIVIEYPPAVVTNVGGEALFIQKGETLLLSVSTNFNSSLLTWKCCPGFVDFAQCTAACPFDFTVSATKLTVTAIVNVTGNYTFYSWYLAVTSRKYVTVLDSEVVTTTLLPPPGFSSVFQSDPTLVIAAGIIHSQANLFTFTWELDGVGVVSPRSSVGFLEISPLNLLAGERSLGVTATFGTTKGFARIIFTVSTPPTASCQAVADSGGVITASVSKIRITGTVTGFVPVSHRFTMQQTGGFYPLSQYLLPTATYTFTAPFVSNVTVSAVFNVNFNSATRTVITATCQASISPPSQTVVNEQAAQVTELLNKASSDPSATLAVAQQASALLSSITNVTLLQEVSKKAASVVLLALNSTSLTADEKVIAVQSLTKALTSDSAATTSSTVFAVLLNVFSGSAGIKATEGGTAVMSLLSTLPADNNTVNVIEQLKIKLASEAVFGSTTRVTSATFDVAVQLLAPSTLGGAAITGSNAGATLPAGFVIPTTSSSASSFSFGSSSFSENPFGVSGAGSTSVGSVYDFSLKDTVGGAIGISNLVTPITLTFTLPASTESPRCLYYDTARSQWSSHGLTRVSYTANVLTCTTTHLSTFGTFEAVSTTSGTHSLSVVVATALIAAILLLL